MTNKKDRVGWVVDHKMNADKVTTGNQFTNAARLDFARHALDVERADIEDAVFDACSEFIEAAHTAIDDGELAPPYSRARERLTASGMRWVGHRYDVSRGVEIVLRAARVGTERMEDEAAGRGPSTPLLCLDVAREVQADVGRWCAARARDKTDERQVARRARWEEARWQVQHVIATEPDTT